MNPFDLPPSGQPVAVDAPEPHDGRPRRGRMALVALLTAGVIGGGIAGISQFASADPPELAAGASDDPDDTVPPPSDDDDASDDSSPDEPPAPGVDGEIVIDVGGDEPFVLDLGELGDGRFEELRECIGLPEFDLDLTLGNAELGDFEFGELGDLPFDRLDELFGDDFFEQLPHGDFDGELGTFDVFGADGGSVTVAGPDGVSVIDLGENGSVTVTKDGDDLTIDTTGDATVQSIEDLFGEFGTLFDDFEGEFGGDFEGAFDEFFENIDEGAFDEFFEGLPAFDELPEFEPLDPDQVESCLDELRGDS